jgi:integrase
MVRNTTDMKFIMMLFIGIFQGLRIGEMVRLKWSHIDPVNGELRVIDGKNPRRFKSSYGKDRVVPINSMFIPIYKKWRAMNPDDEYVLPTTKKRNFLTVRGMTSIYQKRMMDVAELIGIKEVDYLQKDGKARYKYHLHTFRHVCGTNLYRSGMDIYAVKEFLGHEDIKDTRVYCELARDDLRAAAHKTYAYPVSHLPLPDRDVIQIGIDKESLLRSLQN